MALDLEAIKRKLAQLNGDRSGAQSDVQQWKPDVGDHKVRIIPWKDTDGMPFKERSFYYFGKFGCLVPEGDEDPVNGFRRVLFEQAKKEPEIKALAKQLFPKTYYYAKVIVRGQEDKGILIWKMSKTSAQRILGFFVDEDVGDVTDIESGFDLKVKISKTPGKDFADTTIDSGKQCPLTKDAANLKAWTEKNIDIDELHRNKKKSIAEIEKAVNEWLAGDHAPANDSTKEVEKGGSKKATDELDALASEVVSKKPVEKKSEKKTPAPAVDDDDANPAAADLDSAFEDLMND